MKSSISSRASKISLITVTTIVACLGGQAFGQAISLYTPDQSVIEVFSTFNNDAGVTVDGNVNSLPYSTPSTATDSTTSSTVTPSLSTSSLSFSFSQSTPDNKATTSGEGTVFFTALNAAVFSISGSRSMVGSHTAGDFSFFLLDTTTSVYVYQYDLTTGGNTSFSGSLDSSGGPLTGTLTAGDVYEVDAYDSLQKAGAQTLTGTSTITLTATPEPSTWAFMFVGAGLLAGFQYFPRSRKVSPEA